MRTIDELINRDDPGWPVVQEMLQMDELYDQYTEDDRKQKLKFMKEEERLGGSIVVSLRPPKMDDSE